MKTIWKYELKPVTTLQVPIGAKTLCVQVQDNLPCIWMLVDPENKKESRTFNVYGTGQIILEKSGEYVGTIQMNKGALVFHIFEQ